MRRLGRLFTMRPMPQTVCQSSGPSTTANVSAIAAGLTYPVTDACHASGDWYAASWFQRWTVVQTPRGRKANSDPSRASMKSRAMTRGWAGMLLRST